MAVDAAIMAATLCDYHEAYKRLVWPCFGVLFYSLQRRMSYYIQYSTPLADNLVSMSWDDAAGVASYLPSWI